MRYKNDKKVALSWKTGLGEAASLGRAPPPSGRGRSRVGKRLCRAGEAAPPGASASAAGKAAPS